MADLGDTYLKAILTEHHDKQAVEEDTSGKYTSLPPEVDIAGQGRNCYNNCSTAHVKATALEHHT
jgi:hypothetical protein